MQVKWDSVCAVWDVGPPLCPARVLALMQPRSLTGCTQTHLQQVVLPCLQLVWLWTCVGVGVGVYLRTSVTGKGLGEQSLCAKWLV